MATTVQNTREFEVARPDPIDLGKSFALLVYWLYQAVVKAGMIVIYIGFIADGLRRTVPVSGQKIHKVVPFLRWFEATYRMDYAFVLAMLMAFLVCWAWQRMLEIWLEGKFVLTQKEERQYAITFALGTIILIGDACLFYCAAVQSSWSGTKFSLSALIATAVYVAIVISVNYIGIGLKEKTK